MTEAATKELLEARRISQEASLRITPYLNDEQLLDGMTDEFINSPIPLVQPLTAAELHDVFCFECHLAIRPTQQPAVTCAGCHLSWHEACSEKARKAIPIRAASSQKGYERCYYFLPNDL